MNPGSGKWGINSCFGLNHMKTSDMRRQRVPMLDLVCAAPLIPFSFRLCAPAHWKWPSALESAL
jgi:hypothetical protein